MPRPKDHPGATKATRFEVRALTADQIAGRDSLSPRGRRRWSSYTPEYREWLLRQDAKRRGRRV